MTEINPFLTHPSESPPSFREHVGVQLDAFAARHHIKSLRDRLRIGLNEAGILALEQTNAKVEELCGRLTKTEEGAKMAYRNLTDIVVDMQQHGPWEYAGEFKKADAPEIKALFMLIAAESMGYEKEMDLTDTEFFEDVERIDGLLARANEDTEGFFEEAQEHVLEQAESKIRFGEKDTERRVPIGDGLGSFVPMALKGYEVGVVQDAEGWVFVGARGRISDDLIESCGLTKRVTEDPRDSSRQVTLFTNQKGQDVVKKIHRGFLVILSKSIDLATKIAQAVRDEKDAVEIAADALTHTRIIQTSEKKRKKDPAVELEHWKRKQFLRRPDQSPVHEGTSGSKVLSRPREEFYSRMHDLRAMFVYLDALKELGEKREEQERKLTEHDREVVSAKTWEKMGQKVDELRYVNDLIAEHPDMMPESVHAVVDMAGGAGDLGLAVGSDLMATGREVQDIEIVDPQEGTEDFMRTIIDHLPFRKELENIAHHNGGYLQDAHIRPDAAVVAKHACGTLTDDTIKLWTESESPVLIAMTCCQDKAKDHPALYGLSQQKWHDLCELSGYTGLDIPDEPGTARDIVLEKIKIGKQAMYELDMARVEYLRRHGFKAELHVTDKFPKGDVIMARRLPKGFMDKVEELKRLEEEDPNAFDAVMSRLDRMARGGDVKGERASAFGKEWSDDDFAELVRRLSPAEQSRQTEMKERRRNSAKAEFKQKKIDDLRKAKEAEERALKKAAREKAEAFMAKVFHDAGGKPNTYLDVRSEQGGKTIPKKEYGRIMKVVNEIVTEDPEANPKEVRAKIDAVLGTMGY